MARVLLGLYDQPVLAGHQTNYDVNKIGGLPDWMVKETEVPKCRLCGLSMLFLGQFYCPLSGSAYHRTLYVFTCYQPTCCRRPERWTVLRSQLVTVTCVAEKNAKTSQQSVADEWGSEADNWNDDESECRRAEAVSTDTCDELSESTPASDIALKLQQMSIDCDAVGDQDSRTQSPALLSYYLYVIDEPSFEEASMEHEQLLLKRYAEQEGLDLKSLHKVESGGESYSASQVRCGEKESDRTFYKFTKRLSRCPQQLIRYSHRGQPLFARSAGENRSVPCCDRCGSLRVFELQLMPGLVNYLLLSDDNSSTDPVVDYLSVYIFTCERSCWSSEGPDTVRHEFVLVDDDDDFADGRLDAIATIDCSKLAADSMEASSVVAD